MNITHRLTIIPVLGLRSVALAQPSQADLKQRVLTQPQSVGPDEYAFTQTIKSEQTSKGQTKQHVNSDKFDPTKSGDAQCSSEWMARTIKRTQRPNE